MRAFFLVFLFCAISNAQADLNWETYSKDKVQQNLGKKNIIIYFWAEWCAPCQQLRKLTFINGEVKMKLRDFLLLKVDCTEQTAAIEKIQDLYKVESLPVIVFYDKKGKLRSELQLKGFEPPLEFIRRINKL